MLMNFVDDLRFAIRSLARTKGLTITVVLTLALGIGANAAIFTLVRGILWRPLVNRDEDRLIYIRHSAPGIGIENATFSMPEIQDLRDRARTVSKFGDFSTMGFTLAGLAASPPASTWKRRSLNCGAFTRRWSRSIRKPTRRRGIRASRSYASAIRSPHARGPYC